MTKSEIIKEISLKTGAEKDITTPIVENFFKVIKNSLIRGENVHIKGFGSFIIKKRAAKIARNIPANTTMTLPAQVKPHFKPSNEFINEVKEANANTIEGIYFPLRMISS